jgi:hypothetical protein
MVRVTPTNSKSLIGPAHQLEQQRIHDENLKLARRMMLLPSVINKDRLDRDFQNHLKDVANMKRYRNHRVNMMRKSTSDTSLQRFGLTQSEYMSQQSRPTTKQKSDKLARIDFQMQQAEIVNLVGFYFLELKLNDNIMLRTSKRFW